MLAAWRSLRLFALGLPEAYEDFPWGESVAKVNKKVFVFLGTEPTTDSGLGLTVKLPLSATDALHLPVATPSSYGLGKYGWVTLRFLPDSQAPVELLCDWRLESYCAVAPKHLVTQVQNE
jgi:hypothetical protein